MLNSPWPGGKAELCGPTSCPKALGARLSLLGPTFPRGHAAASTSLPFQRGQRFLSNRYQPGYFLGALLPGSPFQQVTNADY